MTTNSAEYPSGLRGRIANPLFVGSNPTSVFKKRNKMTIPNNQPQYPFPWETPLQKEVDEFLDELRESGETNMFGATPYIVEKFRITKHDAKCFLVNWMKNYGERHNSDD